MTWETRDEALKEWRFGTPEPVRCVGGPLHNRFAPDYGLEMVAPIRRQPAFSPDDALTLRFRDQLDRVHYVKHEIRGGETVYVARPLLDRVLKNIDVFADMAMALIQRP